VEASMTTSWKREWRLKTPPAFRMIAAIFIAVSLYFAFTPIAAQLGRIAAYAYCVLGIGLIAVLCVSLKLEFDDQRSNGR
jgi:hypothetical protein